MSIEWRQRAMRRVWAGVAPSTFMPLGSSPVLEWSMMLCRKPLSPCPKLCVETLSWFGCGLGFGVRVRVDRLTLFGFGVGVR